MNRYQRMVLASLEVRGIPYYEGLNQNYPIHFMSFTNMHNRSDISGLSIDFPRTYQGFKDFVDHIGPIPSGMIKPTVGRKDHSLGYVKGNFAWQEHFENTSEGSIRNKSLSKILPLTPSGKKNQNLKNFLESISTPTIVTDTMYKQLGYYSKKDLVIALHRLGKVRRIKRGQYELVP